MESLNKMEVWFVTGSQHLYGEDTLIQVADHSKIITEGLDKSRKYPVKIVYKPTVKTADEIHKLCLDANHNENCIGIITWMHTFSPAKMWISGLTSLKKPFVQFHTQFNRDIPWSEIDMDFMNLNQTAHGGREFGFIGSRLRKERKVIVGYWEESEPQKELEIWIRAAAAWHDSKSMKIARFGDNMREVAVTEGDKVEAQIKFGYTVSGYGLGNLAKFFEDINESEIDELIRIYEESYILDEKLASKGSMRESLIEGARIELAMTKFLEAGGFKAFTTTFENLHGISQLPGLAVQRLMEKGYGFGAEGDWKTAALVRSMKVMSYGLEGGTSFMEDYTYHMDSENECVLGSHMLEVCPSIRNENSASLEIHHLGIGGKSDPLRLVFSTPEGKGINASIMDMGGRFRMVVNEVDVISPLEDLPKLPVARVCWKPLPDLKTSAAAWIYAGGAHHTGFSQAIATDHLRDFASMADIELVVIDKNTDVEDFKKELRWNDIYYHVAKGI
ncbi:MAG: L-arabinose isomerase [Clostridiales bacterium]|nr:L-arabinose isomerase [Clostridiales bacterium]